MNVEWDPFAEEDWRRLDLDDARLVGHAVEIWADTFAGTVEATESEGVFRLYVGRFVVRFLIDTSTDTMHVIQVRRA